MGDKMDSQSHSLLAVLARWFCDEVYALCHRGLVRRYVTHQDDLPVVRGRWHPATDLQRFPGRRDRLHCEFDELTADNPHNRILKAALRKLKALFGGHAAIRRDSETLLIWFGEVADVGVTRNELLRLSTDRLVAHYKRALMMAEWFLCERATDFGSGRNEGFTLLFDMNALFQAVTEKLIRKALPSGFALREEGPRYFLTRAIDGSSRFQMRPDFCLLQGTRIHAIIDTKWKRLEPEDKDGKWGVSQSDVYQLNAYANAYACPHVVLLYPGHSGLGEDASRPCFSFLTQGQAESGAKLLVDWIPLGFNRERINWLASLQKEVTSVLARVNVAN